MFVQVWIVFYMVIFLFHTMLSLPIYMLITHKLIPLCSIAYKLYKTMLGEVK